MNENPGCVRGLFYLIPGVKGVADRFAEIPPTKRYVEGVSGVLWEVDKDGHIIDGQMAGLTRPCGLPYGKT